MIGFTRFHLTATDAKLYTKVLAILQKKCPTQPLFLQAKSSFEDGKQNIAQVVQSLTKLSSNIFSKKRNPIYEQRDIFVVNKLISYCLQTFNSEKFNIRKTKLSQKELDLVNAYFLLLSTAISMNCTHSMEEGGYAEDAFGLRANCMQACYTWLYNFETNYSTLPDVQLKNLKHRLTDYFISQFQSQLTHINPKMLTWQEVCDYFRLKNQESESFCLSLNADLLQSPNTSIRSLDISMLDTLLNQLDLIYTGRGYIDRQQFMLVLNNPYGDILHLDAFYNRDTHQLTIMNFSVGSIGPHQQFLQILSDRLSAKGISFQIFAGIYLKVPQEHKPLAIAEVIQKSAKTTFDSDFHDNNRSVEYVPGLDNIKGVRWFLKAPFIEKIACLQESLDDSVAFFEANGIKKPQAMQFMSKWLRKRGYNLTSSDLSPVAIRTRELRSLLAPKSSAKASKSAATSTENPEVLIKSELFFKASSMGQALRRSASGLLSIQYLRQLLKHATKKAMNAKDTKVDKKMTPLHLAIKNEKLKRACLLIQAGASLLKQDAKGRTPVDYYSELPTTSPLKHNLFLYKTFKPHLPLIVPKSEPHTHTIGLKSNPTPEEDRIDILALALKLQLKI